MQKSSKMRDGLAIKSKIISHLLAVFKSLTAGSVFPQVALVYLRMLHFSCTITFHLLFPAFFFKGSSLKM